MIDIRIKLNNIDQSVNVQDIANDISNLIRNSTNKNCNIQINMQDNNSMSPLGLYKTKEYMRLKR